MAESEHAQKLQARAEKKKKETAIDARYDAMRIKVEAWTPPTPKHENMKRFMLEQLETGRPSYFRYREPAPLQPPDGKVWLEEQLDSVTWDIQYHTKHWQKEQEAHQEIVEWIRALLDDLKDK